MENQEFNNNFDLSYIDKLYPHVMMKHVLDDSDIERVDQLYSKYKEKRERALAKGIEKHNQIETMLGIAREFVGERLKQDEKWGPQDHPGLDQILLNRENGCTPQRMCEEYEIPTENRAKQKCERAFDQGEGTWAHIVLEEFSEVVSQFDEEKQREELVQLGACVMAWIESIDRRTNK